MVPSGNANSQPDRPRDGPPDPWVRSSPWFDLTRPYKIGGAVQLLFYIFWNSLPTIFGRFEKQNQKSKFFHHPSNFWTHLPDKNRGETKSVLGFRANPPIAKRTETNAFVVFRKSGEIFSTGCHKKCWHAIFSKSLARMSFVSFHWIIISQVDDIKESP